MIYEGFVRYLKFEKRYSSHTVTSYLNDVNQFLAFLQSSQSIKIECDNDYTKVNTKQVRNWVVSLVEDEQQASSIKRKVSALKTFFKILQINGIIKNNPADKISTPKIPERLPKFISEKSITQLYENKVELFEDSYDGQLQFIIIELLYGTGIRRDELINIKLTDINWSKKELKILGKGNKERILPLGKEIVSLLSDYIEIRNSKIENPEVFPYLLITSKGEKLYPNYVYRSVKKYLSLCSTVEKKSPHILRHSFATHLSNNGAKLNDIKELLGHSSLASTQIYTHNTIEQLKEIYKLAHPKA
jgi:integrase/recombinase XerC